MIKWFELRMPGFTTAEINLRHPKPRLLAISYNEHLLGMIYHKYPLVSKYIRLRHMSCTFGADESVPVGEVFTVVSVLQVVNILVRAEVVHVVDVGFTDSRLNLVKIILYFYYTSFYSLQVLLEHFLVICVSRNFL
jgi:hypothetical protein